MSEICNVCHTPGCIEGRGKDFHAGDSFGSLKCDYTGVPPFADAEWAKDKDHPCLWCAGTGHPFGDESYGMCACPDTIEQEHKMERVIALVFRLKTGCKQYSFRSLEEIKSWASKKPYKDEDIVVRMIAPDETLLDKKRIRAAEFYIYAKKCISNFANDERAGLPDCFL